MAEQEGKTIHSVAKAIRLLDILTESGQPASLTELYQKTGWPKSTIHGLLSTMRESGLIEQMPNGRYWLGIRLFEYGCAVSNSWDIGTIARPHMQSICAELGESVFLSVFDRAAVVTLAEEESRASLRVVSEVVTASHSVLSVYSFFGLHGTALTVPLLKTALVSVRFFLQQQLLRQLQQ